MKYAFLSILFAFTFFVSCSDDDSGEIIEDPIEAPMNYTFERNGVSTVSFGGQTTRILMASEIVGAFNDFDVATETSVLDMFAHSEGSDDFENTDLNASSKNVRSKTAASFDYFNSNTSESAAIKNTFDTYVSTHFSEVVPNRNTLAEAGVAGQIAQGSSVRYVTAEGLEMNQVFAKGLIGALMTDQMLNNYLSPAVLDETDNRENNDAGITEEGKTYTTMEHKWDEAYGYLFGAAANPENPLIALGEADGFLNKYLDRVDSDDDFNGIASEIFEAFKLGRAAIVAGNYELRDVQAMIIKQKISEVIAIRAVHYLQSGKTALQNSDMGAAFHSLSEGYGFVYSLRFTRNNADDMPFFSASEVENFLTSMMNDGDNGLWDVTPATLDTISNEIAAKFDFTVEMAAN
ncbi:DUF4856 domain-containing protein [Flavobacteriaceae bacterium TK19130]|nr:DUF4856 domain-containing protein [Thermobacterium salinum]